MPMQPSSVLRLDTGTQTTLQKQSQKTKYKRSRHRYLQLLKAESRVPSDHTCTTDARSRSPTDGLQNSGNEICKNEVK
jgi:hypothetical protein